MNIDGLRELASLGEGFVKNPYATTDANVERFAKVAQSVVKPECGEAIYEKINAATQTQLLGIANFVRDAGNAQIIQYLESGCPGCER